MTSMLHRAALLFFYKCGGWKDDGKQGDHVGKEYHAHEPGVFTVWIIHDTDVHLHGKISSLSNAWHKCLNLLVDHSG
jgi:hypothetical protein